MTQNILVFDVGSNVGNKAARFVAQGAGVVCFEPVPECVAELRSRFEGNPSVTIVPCGLGSSPGTLPIYVCSGETTISTFSDAWKHGRFNEKVWDKTVEVPVQTLDGAIADFGLPDYCKIDVEGFELSVLRGLSKPIPVLSFEFCSEGLSESAKCLDHLESLGYRRFNVGYGECSTMCHSHWLSSSEVMSELRGHPVAEVWGDIYAAQDDAPSRAVEAVLPQLSAESDTLDQLMRRGLMSSRSNGTCRAPKVNTNAVASGQDRPRWTHFLPAPVRSLGRPLLREWRSFYGVSREKFREKLAAPCVTSYLMGGCANQIFQYATGLALARRLGVGLKLDVSWYETATSSQPRMYSLGLFKSVDAPVIRRLYGQIIREQEFTYKPALFENAPRKCSLVGYWQSEKYFFHLRDELRGQLEPGQPLTPVHRNIERLIAAAGNRAVLLHVRRSDYVGNPFHVVLPPEYYREAVALVAAKVPEPVFFIFSDEPQWCRANLKLHHEMVIAEDPDGTDTGCPARDDATLWLMRQCRHAIIANSSFSWWGAWLGADVDDGVVIAPKIWVGAASNQDPRDIIPSRWVRL